MLDQLIYEYGLFLEQLRKHIRVSETNINKITIHIGVIDDYSSGQCQCRALVNNVNGKEYRCTRKKKFGDFCGLHFNRKNSFKSIKSSSISSVETFSLNLLEMISDIENNNVYYKVLYDYNIYYINSLSGDYYKKIEDNLVKCDYIDKNNVPYVII